MKHLDKIKIVEELLNKSGITTPPVILSTVLKLWTNLQVTQDNIKGDAFIVDLGSLGTNIMLKKNVNKERKRFSLAHELGHLVLKEKGVTILQSNLKSRDLEVERWCNEFASELLMPSAWIKRELNGCKIADLFYISHKLGEKYQVSFEAMLIRLTEVTPVSVIRFNIQGHNVETKYNKSQTEPIKLENYKDIIINKIWSSQSNNAFYVANGIYCYLQAQRKEGNKQKWISYLAKVSESLTFKFD